MIYAETSSESDMLVTENFSENVETPEAIDLYDRRASRLYTIGRPNRVSKYCRIKTVDEAKRALYAGIPLMMAMD